MPAILTIISEQDVRDYAHGCLDKGKGSDVEKLIEQDEVAKSLFEYENKKLANQKEETMATEEQVNVKASKAKQGGASRIPAKILIAALILAAVAAVPLITGTEVF